MSACWREHGPISDVQRRNIGRKLRVHAQMQVRLLVSALLLNLTPAQTTTQVVLQLLYLGFSVRDAGGTLRAGLDRDDLHVFVAGWLQETARFAQPKAYPCNSEFLRNSAATKKRCSRPSFRTLRYARMTRPIRSSRARSHSLVASDPSPCRCDLLS